MSDKSCSNVLVNVKGTVQLVMTIKRTPQPAAFLLVAHAAWYHVGTVLQQLASVPTWWVRN